MRTILTILCLCMPTLAIGQTYESLTAAAEVWLKLDGNTTDSGSAGITAGVNGSIDYDAGVNGQAAVFDPAGSGGTSGITVSHASLDLSAKDFTIALHVRQDNTGTTNLDYAGIIAKQFTNSQWGVTFDNAAGARLRVSNSNVITDTFTTSTFHSIIVAYDHDTTTAELFVDGVSQGTSSSNLSTTNTLVFGSDLTTRILDGLIDDIVIDSGTTWDADDAAAYHAGPSTGNPLLLHLLLTSAVLTFSTAVLLRRRQCVTS